MQFDNIAYGGGHTCNKCGRWIPVNSLHSCTGTDLSIRIIELLVEQNKLLREILETLRKGDK